MIRNFEELTKECTEYELNYIMPVLVDNLTAARGKKNAVTNEMLRRALLHMLDIKTSGPRIRYMIHVLRVSDIIPFLIATSDGYYVTDDEEEIKTYIGSIEDRLRSIYQIRRALKRQVKMKATEKELTLW